MDYSSKKLTFEQVGGLEMQKKYLQTNIINLLGNPADAKKIGLEAPKGILFYGLPGSGKTLLGHALANELELKLKKKVTFIFHKGTESFSQYVGESGERLKIIFSDAVKSKPSVIFFDELDGLCPSRDKTGHSSGEAYVTVVTTLLGLMDSIQRGEVFVIGSTNRMESIDPAMLRPGRFDKKLVFRAPDMDARSQILNIKLQNWSTPERPIASFINSLARQTVGYTGADLEKLCRDAFFEAFDRCNPEDVDIKRLTLKNLKVLPQDWETAMKKIIPTDSNSFGSCLFVPKSIPDNSIPLLQKSTADIVDRLPLNMLHKNRSETRTLTAAGFLICDQEDEAGFVLDNFLITNVLNNGPHLSHCPAFVINEEKLFFSKRNYINAIDQALSSTPSIILILRLDALLENYPSLEEDLVASLEQVHGKPILVLATAANKDNIGTRLKALFPPKYTYSVNCPSKTERQDFFAPIFKSRALTVKKEQDENKKLKFIKECVEKTDQLNRKSLLDLFAKLSSKCDATQTAANQLLADLDDILICHVYN